MKSNHSFRSTQWKPGTTMNHEWNKQIWLSRSTGVVVELARSPLSQFAICGTLLNGDHNFGVPSGFTASRIAGLPSNTCILEVDLWTRFVDDLHQESTSTRRITWVTVVSRITSQPWIIIDHYMLFGAPCNIQSQIAWYYLHCCRDFAKDSGNV